MYQFLVSKTELEPHWVKYEAPSTLRWRNMKTQLYQSTFRPTVHTNLTRKRWFSKTFFKPEEFENAAFFFYG